MDVIAKLLGPPVGLMISKKF